MIQELIYNPANKTLSLHLTARIQLNKNEEGLLKKLIEKGTETIDYNYLMTSVNLNLTHSSKPANLVPYEDLVTGERRAVATLRKRLMRFGYNIENMCNEGYFLTKR